MILLPRTATYLTKQSLFPRRVPTPAPRLVSVQQLGPGMAELRYVVAMRGAADPA